MKAEVVCNTGPLIALSLLSCQDILSDLYRPIIPQAVCDEWRKGADVRARNLPRDYERVANPLADPALLLQLDRGEASVIQTAMNRGIITVLMDERKGRKIARRIYGLQTLGTAGLLVEAKRAGLIGNLAPLFEALEEHSYWIAKPIVEWALQMAEG